MRNTNSKHKKIRLLVILIIAITLLFIAFNTIQIDPTFTTRQKSYLVTQSLLPYFITFLFLLLGVDKLFEYLDKKDKSKNS